MAEHTPGTGTFECDENGLVVERFADGGCSFDLFDADTWAGSFDDGMKYARLIGARTDLLEALAVARAQVLAVCEHNEHLNNGQRSDLDRTDLEIIDAAIAKATGE